MNPAGDNEVLLLLSEHLGAYNIPVNIQEEMILRESKASFGGTYNTEINCLTVLKCDFKIITVLDPLSPQNTYEITK